MILATGCRPNSSQLTETGYYSKVANDTDYKPVKERNRTARRQNETECSGEGNPGTVIIVLATSRSHKSGRRT